MERNKLTASMCLSRFPVEAHAHMVLDGADFRAALDRHRNGAQKTVVLEGLAAYRDRGVTWIRDGGDRFGVSLLARELAGEYGITYRTCGYAMHKKGFYGAMVGEAFDTISEYRTLLAGLKNNGGNFVKLMLGGILDFETYPRITGGGLSTEWIRETVHIAHEEGFFVMCHTNGDGPIREALLAGIDSLEHGNGMSADTLSLLKETGCVWVPTISPIANQRGDGRFPEDVLNAYTKALETNVAEAVKSGIPLAPGSDAGAYRVPHGEGIATEWEHLLSAVQDVPDGEELLLNSITDGVNRLKLKF